MRGDAQLLSAHGAPAVGGGTPRSAAATLARRPPYAEGAPRWERPVKETVT